MADIKIDLKKVRDANAKVPGMISSLEGSERKTGLLKWRIPEDIQSRTDVKARLDSVVSDMEKAERMLKEIKETVGGAVTSYSNADKRRNKEAAKFL